MKDSDVGQTDESLRKQRVLSKSPFLTMSLAVTTWRVSENTITDEGDGRDGRTVRVKAGVG